MSGELFIGGVEVTWNFRPNYLGHPEPPDIFQWENPKYLFVLDSLKYVTNKPIGKKFCGKGSTGYSNSDSVVR